MKHGQQIERMIILLLVLGLALSGCAAPAPTPAPAQEASASEFTKEGKTLIIITTAKYHPTLQMAMTAFLSGCEQVGYKCETISTDNDVPLLISLAEQALTRKDVVAVAPWTGRPAIYPIVEAAAKRGIIVVWPHFGILDVPGARAIVGADSKQYSAAAAEKMCAAIGDKEGTFALTMATFSELEMGVALGFKAKMNQVCPKIKVLDPVEEGLDPPQAVAKAVALMLANPDLLGALSTTGGGASTWANAQKETGRKIVAMGMDYTEVNLDLIKKGEVFGVVGQPVWEETFETPIIMDKILRGEPVPYWTKLEAPLVTAENVDMFYGYVDNVKQALDKGLLPK